MPDWLSHIIIALIVAELFDIDKKGLVVLGSLLPDFIVKVSVFSQFFHLNEALLFVTNLYHSVIMAFLIPALIVPIFKYNWKKTYLYITTGFILHLFADSLMGSYTTGILLYPFSKDMFSLHLLWLEQYWIILIVSLAVYLIIRLIKYRILKISNY